MLRLHFNYFSNYQRKFGIVNSKEFEKMFFIIILLEKDQLQFGTRNLRTKNANVTSGTTCVSFRRFPDWAPRLASWFSETRVDSTREALRVALPPPRKKKGGMNSYFFPSNLFGLLSLAFLVCSIIMVPAGSAPTSASRSAGRPPVEIVNGSSYGDARQISFPLSPVRSLGEIYLPRKSTGVEFYFFPWEKKKWKTKKKLDGKEREESRTEVLLSFVLRLVRYVYFRIRISVSRFYRYSPWPFVSSHLFVVYREYRNSNFKAGFSWRFNYDRV